jgi:hypothetical protein
MDRVKPKNAKEAKELGLKTYFTGVMCKRGGVAERRLNGDCLCQKCLDASRDIKAGWARENRTKTKEWIANNLEKNRSYKTKWLERNREAQSKRIIDWKKRNKDKVLESTRKYQAGKRNAVPSWYGEIDQFVMQEASSLCDLRKVFTGIKWHIDHAIPLSSKTACGLHVASNLQVIPSSLNVRKINKMLFTEPFEWVKVL